MHHYSLLQDLHRVNLTNEFHVLSLNHDKKGLEFISTLEHKQFPFYGLQYHPEKNLYEWATWKNNPHGPDATIVSQYFANFFVNEGKKQSRNAFVLCIEEMKLIFFVQLVRIRTNLGWNRRRKRIWSTTIPLLTQRCGIRLSSSVTCLKKAIALASL